MDEVFFVTDEVEDVLASLRHLRLCLKEAQSDPHAWKWVVISLFCAVQGAIVCHATGPSGIEVLKKDHAEIEIKWLNGTPTKSGKLPDPDLAAPDALWKRMVGEYHNFPPAGGIILASEAQTEAFQYFKGNRDWFIHFTPKTWTIGVNRIRNSVLPLIDLLQEINDRGYAFRYGDTEAFRLVLAEIKSLVAT